MPSSSSRTVLCPIQVIRSTLESSAVVPPCRPGPRGTCQANVSRRPESSSRSNESREVRRILLRARFFRREAGDRNAGSKRRAATRLGSNLELSSDRPDTVAHAHDSNVLDHYGGVEAATVVSDDQHDVASCALEHDCDPSTPPRAF